MLQISDSKKFFVQKKGSISRNYNIEDTFYKVKVDDQSRHFFFARKRNASISFLPKTKLKQMTNSNSSLPQYYSVNSSFKSRKDDSSVGYFLSPYDLQKEINRVVEENQKLRVKIQQEKNFLSKCSNQFGDKPKQQLPSQQLLENKDILSEMILKQKINNLKDKLTSLEQIELQESSHKIEIQESLYQQKLLLFFKSLNKRRSDYEKDQLKQLIGKQKAEMHSSQQTVKLQMQLFDKLVYEIKRKNKSLTETREECDRQQEKYNVLHFNNQDQIRKFTEFYQRMHYRRNSQKLYHEEIDRKKLRYEARIEDLNKEIERLVLLGQQKQVSLVIESQNCMKEKRRLLEKIDTCQTEIEQFKWSIYLSEKIFDHQVVSDIENHANESSVGSI